MFATWLSVRPAMCLNVLNAVLLQAIVASITFIYMSLSNGGGVCLKMLFKKHIYIRHLRQSENTD